MNSLKVAEASNTRVSWKDEVFCSHDTNSEGFQKLKEAIKQAKSGATSVDDSKQRDK